MTHRETQQATYGSSVASEASARSPESGRQFYRYLDGLRGLAAFAVVLLHAYLFTGNDGQAQRELPAFLHGITLLNLAVPVFIVLSGFVLAPNPVTGRLPGGTSREFLRRRARRILPPYYAALAIFGVVILVVPALQHDSGTAWDSKVPVSGMSILAHLLMFHDFSRGWYQSIDGPMWSVAVEFQIYFLVPLLLLPLWRRVGGVPMVVLAFVIGYMPIALFRNDATFIHPWFIGCFALGFLASTIVKQPTRHPILYRLTSPRIVAASAAVLTLALAVQPTRIESNLWAVESVVAVVVAAALIALPRSHGWFRRFLETRWMALLGAFSYSLYLLHSPLLAFINLVTRHVDIPLGLRLSLMYVVAVPIAVACSYLFHLAVEKRFLNTRQRQIEHIN